MANGPGDDKKPRKSIAELLGVPVPNVVKNVVEGADPTFGLLTSLLTGRPEDPNMAIQLAAGMLPITPAAIFKSLGNVAKAARVAGGGLRRLETFGDLARTADKLSDAEVDEIIQSAGVLPMDDDKLEAAFQALEAGVARRDRLNAPIRAVTSKEKTDPLNLIGGDAMGRHEFEQTLYLGDSPVASGSLAIHATARDQIRTDDWGFEPNLFLRANKNSDVSLDELRAAGRNRDIALASLAPTPYAGQIERVKVFPMGTPDVIANTESVRGLGRAAQSVPDRLSTRAAFTLAQEAAEKGEWKEASSIMRAFIEARNAPLHSNYFGRKTP